MFKKFLSAFLATVISIGFISVGSLSVGAISQQQAIDWVKSLDGQWLDVDGEAGAQCVDLIKAYYAHITGDSSWRLAKLGNANNYASNSLPPGFSRHQNTATFLPLPGDIGVNTTGYGHVYIVESATLTSAVVWDQNSQAPYDGGSNSRVARHNTNYSGGYEPHYFIRYNNFDSSPVDDNYYVNRVQNATCKGDTLWAHGSLFRGEYLMSEDRRFIAIMQDDGNFVVYSTNAVLWSTYTNNGDEFVIQGSDGNVVLYGGGGALWASGTDGKGATHIRMQNDGNLVAYTDGGTAVWATGQKDGKNQFYITKADNIGDDFYALIINDTGGILTNDNGATKWQAEKRHKSQITRFRRNSDGSYRLTSLLDNKCLDVSGASSYAEAKVQFWNANNSNAQKWRIEKNEQLHMFGALCAPHNVMDAAGHQGNFADGTQIWTHRRNNTPAQWFEIRLIPNVEEYENIIVSFNSYGGSAVENSGALNFGDKVIEPPAPTRGGIGYPDLYKFEGWYSDPNLKTKWDFDTGVTENITLYAKWSADATALTRLRQFLSGSAPVAFDMDMDYNCDGKINIADLTYLKHVLGNVDGFVLKNS
ncbi:MAG: InlB B-repeat-containing protein [Oscillospiraceae bacterium]|nr:InlB B-repeat-containing protein [Oscillospiraceae bacterium]